MDPERSEPHPLVSLLAACFWVLLWLLSWGKMLVAFVTISVPKFIYYVLSYSLTFTLNFYSLAGIFILSFMIVTFFIRIRYLNDYEELREQPLAKPDPKELHPDVQSEDVPPTMFHNYLDEFLQAIRVFGFLEKPVFHELARHLQTRRLIAGDSLYLDQDKSFYCVIDGKVQVYARTGHTPDTDSDQDQWEEDDMNGYQLLNEVGSGGTLSSLFTILSLFTEDVKISWQDASGSLDDRPESPSEIHGHNISYFQIHGQQSHSLEVQPERGRRHSRSPSSMGSTVILPDESISNIPTPGTPRKKKLRKSRPPLSRALSAKIPASVARATEDTTLAVIPADAFKRLTKKFPKASAHIVQVILTRFSRVTFNAAHRYLGLTTELLRTEKLINDMAFHPLPPSFYEGGGLKALRARFDTNPSAHADSSGSDLEEIDDIDQVTVGSDYFAHSASPGVRPSSLSSQSTELETKTPRPSTSSLPKMTISESPDDLARSLELPTPGSSSRVNSLNTVNAGDLHSMTGGLVRPSRAENSHVINTAIKKTRDADRRSRSVSRLGALPGSPTSETFDLRTEVMSCIAKSIGLIQPPADNENDSSPGTGGLFSGASSDAGGTPGGLPQVFNSSFGSLSMLEADLGLGDDTASTTSASLSTFGNHPLSGLDNELEILNFDAGSTLVVAGERKAGLFYVIDGLLDVSMPSDETPKDKEKERAESLKSFGSKSAYSSSGVSFYLDGSSSSKQQKGHKHLFTVKPGGIAGYLASLTGTASYVDIKAKTDVYVGFLPSHALDRLLEKRPIVLLTLAKRLISLLSPLVLHMDAALDWMQVTAGQVLWRPGEQSDSFYIVLNGRLRSFMEKEDGGVDIVAEYGQGDTVGELDVITNSERSTTLHAIRDTELARMPLTLFNAISVRNPQTTVQLLRKIASGVRTRMAPQSITSRIGNEQARNNLNLKTVSILPATRDIPVAIFAKKLHAALEEVGAPTSSLNQTSVTQHLGHHAFTRMGKLKLAGWLADLEQRYRIVLYIADSPVNSPWTQTCIRQADYIMVVGMGTDPSLGEYERLLLSMKSTARKELVLLHPERHVNPGSTREWLKIRPWIHAHLHVELATSKNIPIATPGPVAHDPAAMTALKILKSKVESGLQKYRQSTRTSQPRRAEYAGDFARLARRLCGKSVGIVLGGGGARGIAHLGALRALEEYSIPIDYIGGTSIGAFVGGLYARDVDLIASAGRAKQFSSRISNIWRMLSDLTWPVVAYTTGHEFNRAIYKAFYGLHIEDMWLPYFCNTTNILTSRMEIHETGYAWRFIRASMTLAGLVPPLCDNGVLLVDGGYMDNLPVSTMFSLGTSAVIAVDVGGIDDNSPRNFGDTVSGWWILLNRWNPFSSTRNIPAIPEIQSRLAYVSSVRTLEEAKVHKGCLYLGMPVQEYGTMQFGKFEEIQSKGYEAALRKLEEWEAEGKLPSVYEENGAVGEIKFGRKRGRSLRRNSV